MSKRVVLAMSGGVDSSAAAVLLQQQGYEVIGLFMRSGATEEPQVCKTSLSNDLPIVQPKAHKQGCCSASDASDARRVADSLDIPFHALNFQDAFTRIKDYFADEYLAGRTPNPCVMCNNWLKFGKLWEFAQSVGADHIASGHYARIESSQEAAGKSVPALTRGLDRSKDQSYVLFGIRKEILDRVIFPVGNFKKPEIRELARQTGLRVADKPDSQEICFIPDNDYVGFLERYRGHHDTAGEIVDTEGNVLGRHEGYQQYTIGQRKRLGITFGSPRYVVAVQPTTRRVVIGKREDLMEPTLEANRLNWLIDDVPDRFTCQAQIRSQHQCAEAEVQVLDEDSVRVYFAEPQFGVAPGQAVVFYDGDRVMGGGWIA
ncbi:MAG: tRNA 2-thiouridine(34) synthase MnmA [Planctomycetota bacterium]|nr:MAG: tRNA 2-thiouridine(34) synthase MnmA [Planctomycetota bacterium]GDY07086.1 tRNA-specific 2-thiouridylase MnmA [Planctomycetia bacterium]